MCSVAASASFTERDRAVPAYDHVFVIIEENRGNATISDRGVAPSIGRLSQEYGKATQMFAETHPSEPNYVALIGGDTFGIADDDAWYCKPGESKPFCTHASRPGYVSHLRDAPNLGTQLRKHGLDWRAYLEDLPKAGSLAIVSPATSSQPEGLYAAKHTAFTNFRSTTEDPLLAKHLVGFDKLAADLRSDRVPAFALIIPNMCNEMHGIYAGPNVPPTCSVSNELIRQGDLYVGQLVEQIQSSNIWKSSENTAIVVTWDEDEGTRGHCCVKDANNPGGGNIPTLVITNHGPRKVVDATPYNHYSLLRTIEDALGLKDHLRHADDASVLPMVPLFAIPSPKKVTLAPTKEVSIWTQTRDGAIKTHGGAAECPPQVPLSQFTVDVPQLTDAFLAGMNPPVINAPFPAYSGTFLSIADDDRQNTRRSP
jgi:hypothetical protein